MTPEERTDAVMEATKLAGFRYPDEGRGMRTAVADAIRAAVAELRADRERLERELTEARLALDRVCQWKESVAAERDRLAADLARAKELQERMLDCLQNIRDNYDHEEYTHEHRPGYGGICRVCSAERVIGVRQ